METNTNKRAVTLEQFISAHQKNHTEVAALKTQMEGIVAAGAGKIEDAMYQTATRTQYTKAASVTGALAEATVGSLVDDDTLATLTAAGTDDAGNNQYNFLINGVQTGTYTKESKLSAVLDGINSSETAGVNASYDQETGSFVFTARKYGKDQRIEMGEGLADAMFGPPAGSDRSGESFAAVYNFSWLNAGMSERISAVTPGSKYGTTITTETTVQEVINSFNNSSMGIATFFYDKYTGRIAAKDNNNGTLIDVAIEDSDGLAYDPNTNPVDYAPGRDAIFTAIEVNGHKMPVSGKTVEISVPTRASQLENDSKFQTEEQVATAINARVSSAYKAGGSVAFAALPTPDEAHLGFVYNVTDKFTTTGGFVEGAGGKHPAGTNVAIVAVTDGETTSYKYDVLAGFVDLSGYDTAEQSDTKLAGKVDKEQGKGLSSNDFTDAEKEKLAGITFASDEEVAAALAEIYGA